MREIKFRAWNKKEKFMGEPFRITELKDLFSQYTSQKEYFVPEVLDFDDCILMQFIGLKDKNGKEIYNDFIVKYKDEHGEEQIGVVIDLGYKIYIEAVLGDEEGNQDLELHPDYCKEIEVIGNIYENPELLRNIETKRGEK